MALLTTSVSDRHRVLGASEVSQLLQKVRESGTCISLKTLDPIGFVATGGRLIEVGRGSLTVCFDESPSLDEQFQAETPLHLIFVQDQVDFQIKTHCLDIVTTDQTQTIHLHWPADVLLEDRRRHSRRALKTQTHITLESDAHDWSTRAVILNVSPVGLACRAKSQEASRFVPGQLLRTQFQLANHTIEIHLIARVIDVTEAASCEHIVVGLEFADDVDQEKPLQQLRDMLASR